MNSMTREICDATIRFYAANATSFSDTRQRPWEGWEHLVPFLRELPERPTVLDMGCGNLRFERFLEAVGIHPAQVFALDACAELLDVEGPGGMAIERLQADIVPLLDEPLRLACLGIPPCHLTVAFGLMHHLPTWALRRSLVDTLIKATTPQGLCALSFWQFSKDERIAKKAEQATGAAKEALGVQLLDPRDHFLGWQDEQDTFRFCHDFSDAEVNELRTYAESRGATTVDDFFADGKTGDLNRYLVLRRR